MYNSAHTFTQHANTVSNPTCTDFGTFWRLPTDTYTHTQANRLTQVGIVYSACRVVRYGVLPAQHTQYTHLHSHAWSTYVRSHSVWHVKIIGHQPECWCSANQSNKITHRDRCARFIWYKNCIVCMCVSICYLINSTVTVNYTLTQIIIFCYWRECAKQKKKYGANHFYCNRSNANKYKLKLFGRKKGKKLLK